jgi:hypothetical protein
VTALEPFYESIKFAIKQIKLHVKLLLSKKVRPFSLRSFALKRIASGLTRVREKEYDFNAPRQASSGRVKGSGKIRRNVTFSFFLLDHPVTLFYPLGNQKNIGSYLIEWCSKQGEVKKMLYPSIIS